MTTLDLPNLVLTVAEAACQLRISRTKFYELMKAGEIRTVRIGGLRRVPVSSLSDYVNALIEKGDA